MTYQYDLIIIGDSTEGNRLIKSIASANLNIKLAFVSRDFKATTPKDFSNVEYIEDEVTFTDYKNRLFGCYLKNGTRIYATHIIFAVGQKYAPLVVNNKQVPNVFNTASDVVKEAKKLPAIVLIKDESDIKMALEIAKKYKYVYLCLDSFDCKCSEATHRKLQLKQAANIVILPNTHIKKVTAYDENLSTVELDNYSTVTCAAIYAKTAVSPDTACISPRAGLIQIDTEGYLETTDNSESTLVPKCFAVGNCAQKSTNKKITALIETILTDFGGK